MPLTVIANDGVLDATDCTDEQWAAVHRTGSPSRLRCRDCGGAMIAKVSKTGLRFFAHHQRPDECEYQSESAEHRELKKHIAAAIRAAGLEAELEAGPSHRDSGRWRADVLGTAPGGRRVAFEVQLAGMTLEEGRRRTDRYADDGIGTVWVSTKHAHWMSQLPSARVTLSADAITADRGFARLARTSMTWHQAQDADFTRAAASILRGQISTVRQSYWSDDVGGRDRYVGDAVLLVARSELDDFAAHEERLISRLEREAQEAELRRKHVEALYSRQERLLQHAVHDLVASDAEPISLGVPPTPWSGTAPVPLPAALGSDGTARGAAVFVKQREQLELRAVVCPVASRITPTMASSWRQRGVRIYVEPGREAARVAAALRWDESRLRIIGEDESTPWPSTNDTSTTRAHRSQQACLTLRIPSGHDRAH